MTPEEMATLHARAFAGQGRAWGANEFRDLLEGTHALAVAAAGGFALVRVVADEAELLTIATDPDHRCQGVGWRVLRGIEAAARSRGARRVFLEVAEDNGPARALYSKAGYSRIARREGYYTRPDGSSADALILEKAL